MSGGTDIIVLPAPNESDETSQGKRKGADHHAKDYKHPVMAL